ncbi:membrane protein [Filobacillus milosensis]|uniref:Membrane protein n=1 Tax=Filobacillus milosensis TaxID=94137 RepID=A0A4Y8IQV8_9BACI|nr:YitT family protein [Filobacillus milosensis]TFB22854.1 membrane protein [Filobacillus milosensis]
MKELTYSIIFYITGMLMLSFGVTMLIKSELGVGAWDALFYGLYDLIGLTVGSWILIVGIALMIINSFLLKRRIDYAAVITIFLIGVFIDFWILIVFPEFAVTTLAMRSLLLVIGVIFMGAGIGAYLQFDFAKNPIDNLMMAVHYRTGWSLAVSKSSLEVLIMMIAFIIGGPIGIGTFIIALGIGVFVQFFFKRFEKLKAWFVHGKTTPQKA